MEHFPDFMKDPKNKIDPAQQNTPDIEGYYYQGADGSQIAFWECYSDRTSKKHVHNFDEYTICVSGEYIACFQDKEVVLRPGDELYVPKEQYNGEGVKLARELYLHLVGKELSQNLKIQKPNKPN